MKTENFPRGQSAGPEGSLVEIPDHGERQEEVCHIGAPLQREIEAPAAEAGQSSDYKKPHAPHLLPVMEPVKPSSDPQLKDGRKEMPFTSALPIVVPDAPRLATQQRQVQKTKGNGSSAVPGEPDTCEGEPRAPSPGDPRPTQAFPAVEPFKRTASAKLGEARTDPRSPSASPDNESDGARVGSRQVDEEGSRPLCTLPAVELRKKPAGSTLQEEQAKELNTTHAFPVVEPDAVCTEARRSEELEDTRAGHAFPPVASGKQNTGA
ncbi:uncharacterized protein TEOVI_000397300 [Trypanosoma equiperdum]|uniref:Uncharacterized protein n=1 Tax=Trypanosoma equiperdum TaxID=5694 RepID=A0A1G4IIT0_TRYEQ|nr:hypothetical protein, conserved [Trypanosoma equiperdum]